MTLLSSLPEDLVNRILARLPKCHHQMILTLSKEFSHLIRSTEIQKIRAALHKDSIFLCYSDKNNADNWFQISRKEKQPDEDQFVSISPVFTRRTRCSEYRPSTMVAVGPEIFCLSRGSSPQSMVWVYDSRNRKIRQAPSSSQERCVRCAAAVQSKIYVIGNPSNDEKVYAESFDAKTQRWEEAPVPKNNLQGRRGVAVQGKVCALTSTIDEIPNCYNTRDGSCDFINIAKDDNLLGSTAACVFRNTLFIFYQKLGLSWYDYKQETWRKVDGLPTCLITHVKCVALGDYYGKLALMWEQDCGGETKYLWLRMIALKKSEDAISGTAELPMLLGCISADYSLQECLSVSE